MPAACHSFGYMLMRRSSSISSRDMRSAARRQAISTTDVQYLRVYVRQLRQKIEQTPDQPRYITTETGVGYRLHEADPIEPTPADPN